MPNDYSKMFGINLTSLKYFTNGLRWTLYANILNVDPSMKPTKSLDFEELDSFSENQCKKKIKTNNFELSQSTFTMFEES